MLIACMVIEYICRTVLLTKTTAAQNEFALSYHSVRGLYFLAVVSVVAIPCLVNKK